jgi:type IV pilus assembly protein PilM
MSIAVGLDIGSEAVRAAAVETGGGSPVLRRFAEMPLPSGAVVAGDIIDEGAVTEAVRALWKHRRLPRKRLVVGIAGRRVAVCRVEVPRLGDTELAEALPGLVQDAIPLPLEEAVLDFVPLEEFTTPGGNRMLAILAVAAQRGLVESAVAVARRAGLGVMSVDLAAFGLVRGAFGAGLGRESEGSQGLLDIGATLTQVAVIRGGVTQLVHMIPTGGSRFTEALVTGAALDREDAEQRKRITGVAPSGLPAGEGERAVLSRLLTRTADDLIEEIRGVLDGYLRETGERSLSRLLVAGNGARLPHLANRVGRALGAKVEPARVLEHFSVGRIRLTEPQLLKLQPVLPAAVGLALWGSFAVPAGSGPARRK